MATTKATELSQLSSALQVDESTGEIIFTGSLSVDSNTLFIDGDSNRVGIGTLTPGSALDVAGDVTATAFSGDGSALTSVDGATLDGLNSSQFLRSDTSDTLNGDLTVSGDLDVDSGTLFVDSSSNQVGIGTTPSDTTGIDARLHVDGGLSSAGPWAIIEGGGSIVDNISLQLVDRGTSTGNNNILEFGAKDTNGDRVGISRIRAVTQGSEASSGGILVLETAFNSTESFNSNQLYLDNSGNVGIGTSSPNYKLEVLGENNNGAAYIQGGNPDSWGLEIGVHNISSESDLVFNANAVVGSQSSLNFVAETGGIFTWNVGGNSHKTGNTGSTEAMRINSSGNVGIGTSSPDSTLDVNGDAQILNEGGTGILSIYGDGSTASIDLIAHRDSSANQNTIRPFGTRGTISSPADVLSGDNIFTIEPRARVNGEYEKHGRMDFIYNGDLFNNPLTRFENTIASSVEPGSSFDTAYFSGRLGASINANRSSTNNSAFISFDSQSSTENNQPVIYRFGRETDTTASCRLIFYAHDGQNSPVFELDQNGDVQLDGSLSKGSGSFRIDHPLPEKSETHHLVHSFVESPRADNIYRGTGTLSNGTAQVNLDTYTGMTEGTFSALNGNIDVFLQNKTGWEPLKGEVIDNILHVYCRDETASDTISWMVVGERQDQHMLDTEWTDEFGRPILEPEKELDEEDELDSDGEVIE